MPTLLDENDYCLNRSLSYLPNEIFESNNSFYQTVSSPNFYNTCLSKNYDNCFLKFPENSKFYSTIDMSLPHEVETFTDLNLPDEVETFYLKIALCSLIYQHTTLLMIN